MSYDGRPSLDMERYHIATAHSSSYRVGQREGFQVLVDSHCTSVQGCHDVVAYAFVICSQRGDRRCFGRQKQARFIQHSAWYRCGGVRLLAGCLCRFHPERAGEPNQADAPRSL
ncbi:unnamed protein product [Ectocarpus fasciculatus]